MCIICVELEKDKLSPWEAFRNLREMSEAIGEEHVFEVLDLIRQKEIEDYNPEHCDSCEEPDEDCD